MHDSIDIAVPNPSSALVLDDRKKPLRAGHQRRYAPKTRSGCLTCKIRRVKCDEEKPSCRRCTSTGRRCDGYSSTNHAKSPPAEPVKYALSHDTTSTALERRIFEFFRARTAPSVSGYFQDALWDRIVLQISQTEPAVRYAVNALGALHEEQDLRRTTGGKGVNIVDVRTGFPVQQYSKALNAMQKLMKDGNASLENVLLCSLLCIHFEALRESFAAALLHAENAIQVIHASASFDARKVNPSLARALMRVDLQGSLYLGMRVPGLSFITDGTDSTIPSSFHDLTQARDLVSTWSCRVFHFMRTSADQYKYGQPGDIPLELYAKSLELEELMLNLDRLLWDFMHKPAVKLSLREQHGLGILRCRVKINRMLAASCLYSEACYFDRFASDFQDVISICSYIIASDDPENHLFSVSLDEGLILPLFFTATHCRDSRTRHQALDQMDKLKRRERESIWHLETTYRTASMCIEVEESFCETKHPTYEDIPEWRRVHSVGFDRAHLHAPGPEVECIIRMRPNGMDGDWESMIGIINCELGIGRMHEVIGLYEQHDPRLSIRMKSPRLITWP